ncbi:MAG: spondin domain-containing protein [Bacteroidetes bacterium]|nr:spondin domain-containing protein [Bacteroidota bacterium]
MRVINLAGLLLILLLGCSENEPLMTQPEPEPELNARYKLTFNAGWSAQTHPNDFPSSAHFSGLIGMTHNGNTMLFAKGGIASDGIKNMAETGGKNPLETEIQNLISIGIGNILISGGGINPSPGEVSLEFDIVSSYSMVSVVSMIAPSPDWFIAVSNINLIENNEWVTSKTITVDIYDAGTDDGATFVSPDEPTIPRAAIFKIKTPPLAINNVVAPLGTITFTKIEQ